MKAADFVNWSTISTTASHQNIIPPTEVQEGLTAELPDKAWKEVVSETSIDMFIDHWNIRNSYNIRILSNQHQVMVAEKDWTDTSSKRNVEDLQSFSEETRIHSTPS